jgi:nuclear transcription factor Y gamma
MRSWNHTEEKKRRTLQKSDIAAAITRTDIFDFLVDIVPRDDEVLASIPRGTMSVGGPTDALPYCYMPPQDAPHPFMAPQMWPQPSDQQPQPSDQQPPFPDL